MFKSTGLAKMFAGHRKFFRRPHVRHLWVRICVFFSDIVRIFCLMSEIFGVISDEVSEKLLLVA